MLEQMLTALKTEISSEVEDGTVNYQEIAARLQVHIDNYMAQIRDLELMKAWVLDCGSVRAQRLGGLIGSTGMTAAVPAVTPAPAEPVPATTVKEDSDARDAA
jgi:hypothetical protein